MNLFRFSFSQYPTAVIMNRIYILISSMSVENSFCSHKWKRDVASLMVRSIPHGGHIELFLVPATTDVAKAVVCDILFVG